MRIAILGTRGYPYVYSGYETFVAALSVRLVAKGHEVVVYCHRGLFQHRPPVLNGVRLVYLPAIERKILSQFSHSLLSTLHAVFSAADVLLYVNSANGPFGLLTRLSRKRTAINVDGLEWMRPKWKGLGARYFKWASRLSTRYFDEVICDSDRMADIYRDEFGSTSVTIAYGADPGESQDPSLLREFHLEPGGYYLVVGRLIPDNNADLIVEGFRTSSIRRKLVILGDVPYRDAYATRIRQVQDDRLLFPGYVKDQSVLRELYCNAYAYVHGHEFGGTNPALLKALAYGSCVVALDTVFSREVLNDGEYGLYFRKDPADVRRVLETLDRDPDLAQRYRNISRRRIAERYTWERITAQYEVLFLSMISRTPSGR